MTQTLFLGCLGLFISFISSIMFLSYHMTEYKREKPELISAVVAIASYIFGAHHLFKRVGDGDALNIFNMNSKEYAVMMSLIAFVFVICLEFALKFEFNQIRDTDKAKNIATVVGAISFIALAVMAYNMFGWW